MTSPLTMTICETCQDTEAARCFADAVAGALPKDASVEIRLYPCLNACAQGPVIALQSALGHSYVFGPVNLTTDAPDAAGTLIEYLRKGDVIENPLACGRLRACLIACLPPL